MTHAADVIIIGGGISGLATAWHLAQRGQRALVLEGSSTLGGALRSPRTADGFWYELGAHTCYNSYGGLLAIIDQAGLMGTLLPRAKAPFRLLIGGELRGIGSELSVLRLLASLPRLIGHQKAGKTVQQHFSRLVGARNYARVLRPMLAAVPSQAADEIPAQMLFKRRPRRRGVPRSFTLAGGLGAIVAAIAAREGVETRLNAPVTAIVDTGDSWAVRVEDGDELRARALALAVPADVAARLITAARPDLAAALGRVQTACVYSSGYVLRRDKLDLEQVAGIVPQAPDAFWSAVSRDIVPDDRYRAFTFHFKQDTPTRARDRRASEVLGVDVGDAVHRSEATTVLPAPRLGHRAIVAAIERHGADERLAIAGNFFTGLAIEDCVQRARVAAARLTPSA